MKMLARITFEYWDTDNREQCYFEEIIRIEDRAYEKAIRWVVNVAGRIYSTYAENREVEISICEHRPLTFSQGDTVIGANFVLVGRTVNYRHEDNIDYSIADISEQFTNALHPQRDDEMSSRTFEPRAE